MNGTQHKSALLNRIAGARDVYLMRLRFWRDIVKGVKFISGPSGNTLRTSILFAPFTSLRNLGDWENPLLLGDATVESKGVGKFHIRGRSDELFCVMPDYEPAVAEAIRSRLSPGDVFVDAGANIGVYTVLGAKLVGESGTVVSIEMMPDTAARLRGHVELNALENVTVVECALSNVAGETVTATVPEGLSGQATITGTKRGRTVSVRTDTLTNILEAYPAIRMMKMDVEGAEDLAIDGASGILDRIQTIVFEQWDDGPDVAAQLSQAGFHVRRLDRGNFIAERAAS